MSCYLVSQHQYEHPVQQLGRGFLKGNLCLIRQFYRTYSIWQSVIAKSRRFYQTYPITQTPSAQLQRQSVEALTALFLNSGLASETERFSTLVRQISWSHFVELIRIEEPSNRSFYEIETLKNRWSVRELEIMACERLLEQVKINVLPNLGYGAEIWSRLVKDEDFFGDVDSDTALTIHE